MLRRVHPKKRSVSWVNSVLRQFLPNGSSLIPQLMMSAFKVVNKNLKSNNRYLTAAVCFFLMVPHGLSLKILLDSQVMTR